MRGTLEQLSDSAKGRAEVSRTEAHERRLRMGRLYAGAGIGVLVLIPFFLLGVFVIYIRPLRRLLARTREVRAGKLRGEVATGLRGHYAEIETAIDELGHQVHRQQRDRQAFVTAVATDLRVPWFRFRRARPCLRPPTSASLPSSASRPPKSCAVPPCVCARSMTSPIL